MISWKRTGYGVMQAAPKWRATHRLAVVVLVLCCSCRQEPPQKASQRAIRTAEFLYDDSKVATITYNALGALAISASDGQYSHIPNDVPANRRGFVGSRLAFALARANRIGEAQRLMSEINDQRWHFEAAIAVAGAFARAGRQTDVLNTLQNVSENEVPDDPTAIKVLELLKQGRKQEAATLASQDQGPLRYKAIAATSYEEYIGGLERALKGDTSRHDAVFSLLALSLSKKGKFSEARDAVSMIRDPEQESLALAKLARRVYDSGGDGKPFALEAQTQAASIERFRRVWVLTSVATTLGGSNKGIASGVLSQASEQAESTLNNIVREFKPMAWDVSAFRDIGFVATAWNHNGQPEMAKQLLDRQVTKIGPKISGMSSVSLAELVSAYASIGESQKAFDLLNEMGPYQLTALMSLPEVLAGAGSWESSRRAVSMMPQDIQVGKWLELAESTAQNKEQFRAFSGLAYDGAKDNKDHSLRTEVMGRLVDATIDSGDRDRALQLLREESLEDARLNDVSSSDPQGVCQSGRRASMAMRFAQLGRMEEAWKEADSCKFLPHKFATYATILIESAKNENAELRTSLEVKDAEELMLLDLVARFPIPYEGLCGLRSIK